MKDLCAGPLIIIIFSEENGPRTVRVGSVIRDPFSFVRLSVDRPTTSECGFTKTIQFLAALRYLCVGGRFCNLYVYSIGMRHASLIYKIFVCVCCECLFLILYQPLSNKYTFERLKAFLSCFEYAHAMFWPGRSSFCGL